MSHVSIEILPSMHTITMGARTLYTQAAMLAAAGNHAEALPLFLQSAEKGWPPAYLMVAEYYQRGRGTATNYPNALKYYLRAASCLLSEAMYQLSLIYREGLGVPADEETSDTWLQKAACQGHCVAIQEIRARQRMQEQATRPEAPSISPPPSH